MSQNPQFSAAGRLIALLAYDGLDTFEYSCAVEVFDLPRIEMGSDWYRFAVVAAESGDLHGTGGILVQAHGGLEMLRQADTIIVPGWRGPEAPVPLAICTALQAAHQRGSRLLSFCAGAFVLAAAGLLSGKRATTHWQHAAAFARLYPLVVLEPNALYVDAGDVLTSAGSLASIDLCLHLVRRDFGMNAANKVARRMVIPPRHERANIRHESGSLNRLAGARFLALIDKVRSSLEQDWSIDRLAAEVAMSPRSLQRRFSIAMGTPPGEWLMMERLMRARKLLEETNLPIEKIAFTVGFHGAATLRKHFREQLGALPTTYRRELNSHHQPSSKLGDRESSDSLISEIP
ncbi:MULTISPECIES: helix-turn-helix domain-containing protein [Paraburkholderia]|uniref:helix-turn-helix domain-containing protein n=1 Tax=Paraburkholderia TaxID=1822464 RepID=UPI002252F62D|nr:MULTISPECIES: helix-turn-helix domain-containing protein [Paraburkholderia]MCX4162797.1 helix-turn-helix domain-containing protein [Paraburkholderia megapolitana]MDN7158292.1 helix-turn-helix domain-containing protein [Paraburkholderia sp. CHISQ3]MDQ6495339.1 helix-turn-helix domain-containing protein [Paraburkholderia megapolitana]